MNREEAENSLHDVVIFARACYTEAYTAYDRALREGKPNKKGAFRTLIKTQTHYIALTKELESFYGWTIEHKNVEANISPTFKGDQCLNS